MDSDRDLIVVTHLENWIAELEQKLAYPKNDWKRKEQLTSELADAKQRLQSLAGSSRRVRYSSDTPNLFKGNSQLRDAEPNLSSKKSRPVSCHS